ncbi:MAG: hypothetical protein DRJ03_00820 [Chloroflexi bacterium]|nr:MAG: hypothetical protein DRJ03_00820 [Chloroflexota bacterium]
MFDDVCPVAEDFFIDYECEFPPATSKAMRAAKTYDGECGAVVTCSEYLTTFTEFDSDAIALICGYTEDPNGDGEFDALDCQGDDGSDGNDGSDGGSGADGSDGTDGANGSNGSNGSDGADGADGIDGVDGQDGPQGPPGQDGLDGVDGIDGLDGEGCDVIDNLDATCLVACGDSEVLVYNCGSGADSIEDILTGFFPEEEEVVEEAPGGGAGPCGAFGGLTVVGMLLPLGLMRFRSRRYSA